MNIRSIVAVLLIGAAASAAVAETVLVDDKVVVRDSTVPRPQRGMHMSAVEQQFGAPVTRHETVGQPPITRWDYSGFAVFFERDIVIHAVATSG
ncbi:MAG TPA: hypothetical protein VNU73_05320 [Steroidobacteraceae bacterium]|jgi:hypothetical protein|nr:hypothetical protein [Steroidobacteraceae bacterium]